MIVADASALLDVLLRTPPGLAIEERMLAAGETLHVPHLIDIEVAQTLRRYARAGQVGAERYREVLSDFATLPLRRYSHGFLLPRIWELRNNLTAYDAAYVALAEILDAVLVTSDRRLAAAPGLRAEIEVF